MGRRFGVCFGEKVWGLFWGEGLGFVLGRKVWGLFWGERFGVCFGEKVWGLFWGEGFGVWFGDGLEFGFGVFVREKLYGLVEGLYYFCEAKIQTL